MHFQYFLVEDTTKWAEGFTEWLFSWSNESKHTGTSRNSFANITKDVPSQ